MREALSEARRAWRMIALWIGPLVAVVLVIGLGALGGGEALTRLGLLADVGLTTHSPAGWFASASLRVGLVLIGPVILVVRLILTSDERDDMSLRRGGGHRGGGGAHRRTRSPGGH